MGTVKYTGPVASFHCPTNAEIRSLKVHFSPKQDGSGDPSPENVREIEGWDGVEAYQTGKNIWDEEWELGYLNTSTGVNAATSSQIRAKNYIKLLPNTTYYVKYGYSGGAIWAIFFDQDKKVISDYAFSTPRSANVFGVTNRNFTTPSNCYFMRFYCTASYGTTYRNDIAVCIASTATPYESYQGSTTNYEFGVLGKNKFDYANANIVDKKRRDDNGNAVGDSSGSYCQTLIPVEPNTTYTVSGYAVNNDSKRIYYIDAEENFIARTAIFGASSYTFTTPSNCYYIQIQNREVGDKASWETVQLELGSTATTYEPYDPNKTLYGGWVDIITGEVSEQWKNIDLDTLTWTYDKSNSAFYTSSIMYQILNNNMNMYCNIYPTDNRYVDQINENAISSRNSYGSGKIFIKNLDYITVEDFVASLDGAKLVFPLRQTAYNTYNLPPNSSELKTFLAQNNIWSNADYVEVEYDLHETQSILARKQFIVANQPHIVKPAAAPLQNFVTDMAAPLKECKVGFKPVQDLHGYSKPWVGGSGKNLFNINAVQQDPSDTTLSNTTKRIFTPNTYSVGASYSNWWQPNKITNYSITDNNITVTSSTGYGVCFAIKAKPETYYTVSAAVVGDNPRINNAYYDSEGNYLGSATTGGNIITFQTPENTDMMVIIFAPVNNTEATFSNIQVEEGQTATSYEPYENICPISGWTGLEVNQSGKNINNNWLKPEGLTASGYYNGYSSWAKDWTVPASLIGTTLHYSAFIDNTGTTDTRDAYLHIWTKDINGTYIRTNATSETHLNPGESGRLVANITPRDTEAFISCGLTMPAKCKASEPLLEIGSIGTDYEPYTGTTIPITFPSEAGTIYGGYVDLVKGEVVVEWYKIVADGVNVKANSSYMTDNYIAAGIVYLDPIGQYSSSAQYSNNVLCDILPVYSQNYLNRYRNEVSLPYASATNAGNQYIVFYLANRADHPEVTDATSCKNFVNAWLQEHPTTIVYELKTPIHYSLTPTQLKTLRGTNNVWSTANGNIEVAYWGH